MRLLPHAWLSMLIALCLAMMLAPVLVLVPAIKYLLVYWYFSPLENVFLLTAISGYGLAQLALYRLRFGKWRAHLYRVIFYCIAAMGVWVMGLVSLALLWVMPMAVLLFDDNDRPVWQKSNPMNS